jgi:DNA-binding CsgD family transcriptional regulator
VRLLSPLTGRTEEMEAIAAAMSAADCSGIIVSGAAGVGKSRLAREVLSSAVSSGCDTRWAVGTSAARNLPLGAFASWAGSAGANTLDLVRGVIESLTSASPGTQVVIGVDDVHLLDDLSAFVLHQIAQRRAAQLVLTIRDGEPVSAAVQDVWRGAQFERLDLQPLSRRETAILLSATLGGAVGADAIGRLWNLTCGNVLYLRNIVEQEVSDGRLVLQGGHWQWTGNPIVPPSLVELIEARIGTLPESVADVIDALAVGEPLDLATLTRISDRAAVEDADTRGLITLERVNGQLQARIAHPLYAEVRRSRAAPTRLRRLRGLIATELAESALSEDMRVVVQRAALSLESDLEPDAELLIRAAGGALILADMPLADRLADSAIRAGGGPQAHFIRSYALAWLGRPAEADAVLAEIPTEALTEADRVILACHRISGTLWGLADPAAAKRLIDETASTAPPAVSTWVAAQRTIYWAAMAQPSAARASARGLVLEELPDIMAGATSWAMTVALGDSGHTTEAVGTARIGYAIVDGSVDSPHMRFLIADKHISALLQAGRILEAAALAEEMERYAADLPGAAQLFGTPLSGRAALGAGRLAQACDVLQLAAELLTGEANGLGYRYRIPYTTALALRGMVNEAAASLSALEKHRHPSYQFVDYERGLARAWVAACEGSVTNAVSIALATAETAKHNGQFAAEVTCLQAATQMGDRTSESRLRELTDIVEGPRVALAARFAAGVLNGDGAALDAISVEFEDMSDLVAAMDAAAHAALVHRRNDMRGSALTSSARAEAIAERCGGALTPALQQAVERLPLTDREREIGMLIGQGLSSREVAHRLTLSTRTVESHLYRAMAKTGTTSRDGFAALLRQQISSGAKPQDGCLT